MSRRIVLALGLLGASWLGTGCGDDVKNGAVRLTIRYSGFVPGCVRVRAEDAKAASNSDEQTLTAANTTFDGQLVVAVYREKSWSHDLKLTVTAHEQACTGAQVATQTATAAVTPGKITETTTQLTATDADGDGWIAPANGGTDCADDASTRFPGATEVCNSVDEDCDGEVDEGAPPIETWADGDGDGFGTGTAISECTASAGRAINAGDCNDGDDQVFPGATERCNGTDDDCNASVDDGLSFFPTYVDADADGFGTGTAVQECATSPGRATATGDCNDGDDQIRPGAPERCDGVDNNCDTQNNEGFGVGTLCDPEGACTDGNLECIADGGTGCVEDPPSWFADVDRDTSGRMDGGVAACVPPAGYVAAAMDCDDGDPFTNASLPEICDRRDNNCNGFVDEGGACGATDGGWLVRPVGGTVDDFSSVTAADAGWWWFGGRETIGGQLDRADLVETRDGGWLDRTTSCVGFTHFYGVWAEQTSATSTTVYAGGCIPDGGQDCINAGIAKVDSSGACLDAELYSGVQRVKNVVGVRAGTALRLFAVTSGAVVSEINPADLQPMNPQVISGAFVNDIHGLDATSLYVVGTTTAGTDPKVFHLEESGIVKNWVSEPGIDAMAAQLAGELLGVWVVHPDLVYAVGENGMVLKKEAGTWTALPNPNGNADVSSVRAFGTSAVYVTTGNAVYRYNGASWQLYFNGTEPLRDIAGVRPDDLIVVGDNAQVVYSP